MVLLLPLGIAFFGAGLIFCFANPSTATRVALALGAAEVAVLAGIAWRVYHHGVLTYGSYLRADGLTSFFLINIGLTSGLVLIYASGYMRQTSEDHFFSPRWFYALVFLFLFTMLGVCLSSNLGLLWIMMEATTLASALLVGFYNTEGAVEAGWKYLVVCTVGIAFALFGTIVLYLSAVRAGINPRTALDWAFLADAVPRLGLDPLLVKLAFVFVVVGYGTKIGFVPMHSWLPDAHAEAPSPVSALLSAVLLNCALYALLRYDAVVSRVVGPAFPHALLLLFGLLSIVVAGLLILVQRDLKRLLAYSSIEHMGITAIGIGLGGPLGLYGALLHTFNHSMAKSLLFFAAGNARQNFGTVRMERLSGLARTLPQTAGVLTLGGLAIVGLPPFSLFISEFAILSEAFSQSRYLVAGLFLVTLSIVFGGFLHHFLGMICGEPKQTQGTARLAPSEWIVTGIAAACLLLFGIHIPHLFNNILQQAAAVLR
jgi:hydrogenase-4 component F